MLMNHAADAVTPLNPDPVRVGDVAGQPAQRRGLLQGAVRPVGAVEVFVLPQHGYKVALVPYQSPVEQFAAATADPPFHDRIREACRTRVRGVALTARSPAVRPAQKVSPARPPPW